MKLALAQINPTVGDIAGNSRKIEQAIAAAEAAGAELVVFSELTVTGYPPRDLLSRATFVQANVRAVEQLAARCRRIAALVGFVRPAAAQPGRPLENAAALLADGRIQAVHVKHLLPTYDVFDETRYFQPGTSVEPLTVGGRRVGVSICEDLWDPSALGRALYEEDPIARLRRAGAEIVVNMSASPFQAGKAALREELVRRQGLRTGCPIVYVNQVGGNDELIFDGASLAIAADGTLLGRAAAFREDLLVVDTAGPPEVAQVEVAQVSNLCAREGAQVRNLCHLPSANDALSDIAELCEALKLGLRDFVHKIGLHGVVLGLSGGVDSAVVATLAADALGPENVLALAMPSRYSSAHSLSDAQALASALGIRLLTAPIEPMHAAFERTIGPLLPSARPGTADENVQARVRGATVMYFSNAGNHLALATGNKSELATGYCTLYGDMNGGLAPIGDVYKTTVYRLARHLNEPTPRIPPGTLTKPPSAELKPNQTDQDKLPPYELLDAILERYIEAEQGPEQIVSAGFEEKVVRDVINMVTFAEYKRRQAPPVLKVSPRAFGSGRRIPIACRWRQ